MAWFRKKAGGPHTETRPDGSVLVIKAGKEFESEKPLDRIFPAQFERVLGAVARVSGGKKRNAKEDSFLGETETQELPEEEVPEGDGDEGDSDEQTGAIEEGMLGEDVTEKYEAAKDAGVRVFKDGQKYFVCDQDTPNDALNKKPLKKGEVEGFIAKKV